jgi:hypothetical protein
MSWLREDKQDGTWYSFRLDRDSVIKVFKPLWRYDLKGTFLFRGISYYLQTLPYAATTVGVSDDTLAKAKVVLLTRIRPRLTEYQKEKQARVTELRQELAIAERELAICEAALKHSVKLR